MERVMKLAIYTAFAIFIFQGKAYAKNFEDRVVYFGADAEYSFYSLNTNYKKYVTKQYPGGSIYLGWRPKESYSLELGYSSTSTKGKDSVIGAGAVVAGTTTATVASSVSTRVRLKNTHLDANYYFDIHDELNGILTAGIGAFRQKITTTVSPAGSNVVNIFNIQGRTNYVPRLGFGVGGMLGDNWGMRAMFRYQFMTGNRIRDNGSVLGSDFLRHGVVVSLGFYRFFDH